MQAENKKSKKKKTKKRRRMRWRNAECRATASKTFTNLPRFAAMCLILAWPTRVRNYSWVLLRWSNLRRVYLPPSTPWLTIPSSSLLHSVAAFFCLLVFSVAIFVINCLHIFLPFCQFSTTHHVICTDHLAPPSLSTSVSVASEAPSNWRPALCHAPHCRLICRACCCCCCCTCHSLSLLHIYIYNNIHIYI